MIRVARAGLALGVVVVAACGSAPVPEGYMFPTWNVGRGGAAALLGGTLVADGGCLYVQTGDAARYLVVWPNTLQLVIEDGVPVVMDGASQVARVGEIVELGGGEITAGMAPAIAAGCDRTWIWGANEVVEREDS